MITTLCRCSKQNYYSHYFSDNFNNINKVWQGIKSIISAKSKSNTVPTCLEINNVIVTDQTCIANTFNDYFSTIASKIRDKIPNLNKHFSSFLENPVGNTIFLSPTNPEEVFKCISALDLKKSTGPFSIPSKILSLLKNIISVPLSEIINLSFSSGLYPADLKIAKVIPVFKKGSLLNCSNYRPISLLSNINKIFEKLLYFRLYGFLDKNNVLFAQQFGFRKSLSTSQTLLNISQLIMDSLDKGMYGCGVFIDLQKAFDTVDHKILLEKLYHYGIRGNAHDLLKSYLHNRQQFVSINGFESEKTFVKHGVPQGSVLGPLLFLIYINNLHLAIKYSQVHHFADDTNLLHFNNSLKNLSKKVNLDLKFLYSWLVANKISLNAGKTEYIIFKHPRKAMDYNVKLKINGTKLYPSNQIKYLGVWLDRDLNWHYQINAIALKLKKANGALTKLRHYVPPKTLKLVYYAIFDSHLKYCAQIWGQPTICLVSKISVLQNRAIRLMSFESQRISANPILCKVRYH